MLGQQAEGRGCKRLNRLNRKASDVVGVELDSDVGVREEDAVKVICHLEQWLSSTP